MRALAARKGATPGQLALAWLLHKGDDVVPIPGTKRRTYLEENVAAAALSLSSAEVAELDAALPAELGGGTALRRGANEDGGSVTGGRANVARSVHVSPARAT